MSTSGTTEVPNEQFNPCLLQPKYQNGKVRRYIVIVGAMKSGTTTLFELLSQHPAIAPCRDKEPGFFAFEDTFAKGFDWFDTLFDFDENQHEYRLEASTDYTKFPFVTGTWERMIKDPLVEFRLLYIMRHPLRRIESHANHTQRKRKEIGQLISPRPDHGLEAGLSPVSLVISAYATQLDYYKAAREKGILHWLTLEELKADPDATLGVIWQFLGLVDPGNIGEVSARNTSINRTRLHPAWGKVTRNRRLLRFAKILLPRVAQVFLKSLFQRRIVAKGRFHLSKEEGQALAALFGGEINRLKSDYGVDTSRHWGL